MPALAAAVEAGEVGDDHIREICNALDTLPHHISPTAKARAERTLVGHAVTQDSAFVAIVGRRLADVLNPDGEFDDRDRARRRGLVIGPQGSPWSTRRPTPARRRSDCTTRVRWR